MTMSGACIDGGVYNMCYLDDMSRLNFVHVVPVRDSMPIDTLSSARTGNVDGPKDSGLLCNHRECLLVEICTCSPRGLGTDLCVDFYPSMGSPSDPLDVGILFPGKDPFVRKG